ncbi:MAG: hypothetical protein ACNA8K_16950 [Cyclonatronaceae bacterium]
MPLLQDTHPSSIFSTTGPAGWVAGGIVTGALNPALSGGDLGSVVQGGVVGGISGLAGGFGGQAASRFGGVVINGTRLNSPFINGAITGALGGAGGGFAGGATGALLTGGDILQGGLQGALTGAAIGGGIGAGSASMRALRNDINPFTGRRIGQERVGGTSFRGPNWAKVSGIVRDATKGKGNFGLGLGTLDEALAAGKAWVGEGYTVAKNGRILISSDGLRQFRLPSYKPNLGIQQANFEWRIVPRGQWQGNGHLDIIK